MDKVEITKTITVWRDIMDLKPALRKKFEARRWAVHTTQQMTQNSISEYLDEHGGGAGYGAKKIKHYRDSLEVYIVPFSVIEYLIDNRAVQGFKFVAYHDENHDDFWVKWREEKRTEWEETKITKRDGLLARGARDFRQRSTKRKLPL